MSHDNPSVSLNSLVGALLLEDTVKALKECPETLEDPKVVASCLTMLLGFLMRASNDDVCGLLSAIADCVACNGLCPNDRCDINDVIHAFGDQLQAK